VMTRTTLKALWFGGGGVLATWFAVAPNTAVGPVSPPHAVQASAPRSFEELSVQSTRLRERRAATTPHEATRNPFRFNTPKPVTRAAAQRNLEAVPQIDTPMPVTPPQPLLTLSGMAQKSGKRTAIITGAGQLYLVAEGDTVAGLYTVVQIDPEEVLLRDAAGTEQRLRLPR
jgi:hypothetical protein